MAVLKVSSRSNPNAVAGAFAGVVRDEGAAEVHVVGAGALNQAIKAVAIARGFLLEQGIDLVCVPSFTEIDIDGRKRTAIRLAVESRGADVALDVTEPADVQVESRGLQANGEGPKPLRIS
jgi:stage V sporulation protein S